MDNPLPTIGILAYGSLLECPGEELETRIVAKICCETPFPVEYARSSSTRAKGPTLVRVPEGIGKRVSACILSLRPDVAKNEAANMLYQRELHTHDKSVIYDDAAQRAKGNGVIIEILKDFANVSLTLYTELRPNILEVLRDDLLPLDKARVLAQMAVSSVTAKTFSEGLDGIKYLADAMKWGVQTELTELYSGEILRIADDAPDLMEARHRIAMRKKLIS